MKAGRLRHRVEIHGLTIVEDEIGNQIEAWAKVAEAWASIEPLNGNEYFTAAYTAASVTHRVTMRPPAVDIHPSHKILFDGRTFDIQSILNIEERNRELQLMCKEQV